MRAKPTSRHVENIACATDTRPGKGFRIVQKRVDLINCDCAFEAIAMPI